MSNTGLSKLQGELEYDPGIASDYVEQYFHTLAGLWQKGEFSQIAIKGEQLLQQNIFDIRIVTYYLYSQWVTPPRKSLQEVFESLNNLLEQPTEIWLPLSVAENENKNDNHQPESAITLLEQCLSLLLGKLDKRLKHYSEELSLFADSSNAIVAALDKLELCLQNTWQLDSLAYQIRQLKKEYFLINLEQTGDLDNQISDDIYPETYTERSLKESSFQEVNFEETSDQDIELQQIERKQQQEDEWNNQFGKTDQLDSYPLQMLKRKISVFEQLIERKDIFKAAIVAEDIQAEINNFNPLHYLPLLFNRYSQLRAATVPHLNQYAAYQETDDFSMSHWQALKDYYAIDMNGFMEMESPELVEAGAQSGTDAKQFIDSEHDDYSYYPNEDIDQESLTNETAFAELAEGHHV